MAKQTTANMLETEERVDKVEEMLCAGIGPSRIERTLAKDYRITVRQARRYIALVYQRWREQTRADAPHRREKIIRMTERFYARALSEKQYTAASSALSLLAKMSGALAQHDPDREQRMAALGPPPDDPTQALVWAQRCMVQALSEVVFNPSLDPERRLRWIAELGGKLGMTHAKALVEAKLDELSGRLCESARPDEDTLAATARLDWPATSRFGSGDASHVAAAGSGAAPATTEDR